MTIEVFSALAQMQNSLYTQMLSKFTDDNFTDAGFATADVPKQLLKCVLLLLSPSQFDVS
jgi:hypothetical protein